MILDVLYRDERRARVPASHAMSVNGSAQPTGRDILKMATEFGVGDGREILDQVVHALGRWHEFADLAGVAKRTAKAIWTILEEGRALSGRPELRAASPTPARFEFLSPARNPKPEAEA